MKASQSTISIPGWIKPLLFIVFAAAVTGACKEQSSSSGGMPSPPSGGGMPAPPGPPPSGGGSSGSSGGGGMPPPPMPSGGSQGGGSQDGGSQGGGSQDGSSGPSGSPGGSSGSGGEVGSFPGGGGESAGVPPPPSSSGEGGDGDMSGDAGSNGDGDSEEPSEWDEEASTSEDECGDTGSLPGGVGGMGQDGECIGGGASASESDSSSESSAGGGAGAEGSVQGTGGAGSVGEFPEETADERAERLGQELDKSIGGFDEILQEEQSEISSAGRNTEGFGEGATGASGGGISLGEQASGSANPVSVANTGISRESPTAGMSQDEIRERTPEDIPILVDDDIIARQLREAALAEDDPALRDRLWEEYRKYSGI